MSFKELPTFSKVIQAHIDRALCQVHVSMPAEIVSYDRSLQKARVQPLLQRQRVDGQIISFPIISDVPCIFPRTSTSSFTFELKPGDTGTLLVSERSLDRWLTNGGLVDPADFRKFDISDAQFIPGLFPFSDPAPAEANITKTQNDKSQFAMTEDGKFRIKNTDSGEEFVTIGVDLIQALIDALIRTSIGPQPFTPSTIAAFEDLKARLETLKE